MKQILVNVNECLQFLFSILASLVVRFTGLVFMIASGTSTIYVIVTIINPSSFNLKEFFIVLVLTPSFWYFGMAISKIADKGDGQFFIKK